MKRILFLLTFGLTGTALLLALGSWQLRRLEWKEALLAGIEARISAPPVALPEAPDPARDDYLPVEVTGTILPGELHVLVSRKGTGAGYRIIAPFRTEDGRRILLDRGYVPDAEKDAVRVLGPARITGSLRWPRETDSFTPKPDRRQELWYARDVAAMAAALDTEPVLLVATAPTDPAVRPMPVDTSAIPNDHLQYAITWFSLAAIWVAMTFYFLRSARNRPKG